MKRNQPKIVIFIQNEKLLKWYFILFNFHLFILKFKINFFQSVHSERWQQITDRKQQRQDDYAQRLREAVIERETFANNKLLDDEAIRKKCLENLSYGKELLIQVEKANQIKVYEQ